MFSEIVHWWVRNPSRGLNKCLVFTTTDLRARVVATYNRFKPQSDIFTDRSKAVLLLWFTISIIVRLSMYFLLNFLFWIAFWPLLLERNCPLDFLLVVWLWSVTLSASFFPFGVLEQVFGNCIESWSLRSFLFTVHLDWASPWKSVSGTHKGI